MMNKISFALKDPIVEDRLNQMVLYAGWEAMNGDDE